MALRYASRLSRAQFRNINRGDWSRCARVISTTTTRCSGSSPKPPAHVNVEELLATPTWSVSSLLPPAEGSKDAPAISAKQLHHLLRLSALPPPKDDKEESDMLQTLASQLHFIKEVQRVDTTGIEPFRSLRDETAQGEKDAELGLAALQPALDQEVVVGKHHKRLRRQRITTRTADQEWDPLQTAGRKIGRYFVVEGGKDG